MTCVWFSPSTRDESDDFISVQRDKLQCLRYFIVSCFYHSFRFVL